MGFERSESAAAVLGLEGFVLLAAVEVDGELHQLAETRAATVGCFGLRGAGGVEGPAPDQGS